MAAGTPWHCKAHRRSTPTSASIVTWLTLYPNFLLLVRTPVTGPVAHPNPIRLHLKLITPAKTSFSNKVIFTGNWDKDFLKFIQVTLIRLHMFQVHMSMIWDLYIALCAYHPKSDFNISFGGEGTHQYINISSGFLWYRWKQQKKNYSLPTLVECSVLRPDTFLPIDSHSNTLFTGLNSFNPWMGLREQNWVHTPHT